MLDFINLKKTILVLSCIKLLILDSFFLAASAQTFDLFQVNSSPVSYQITSQSGPISLSSLPVSFSTDSTKASIIASSKNVSFITSLTPTTVSVSSKPASYSVSNKAQSIKLTSSPVSFTTSTFDGSLITATSSNVSYKIYNGKPILKVISPNILPVKNDGSTYDISLQGENFSKGAVASIGTLKINTKYVSSNELIATLPSSFVNKVNSFEVFASNPVDGGISDGIFVMAIDPVPIAKINANPNIGVLPQVVTFDGTDSDDILAKYFSGMTLYAWDFGDPDFGTENPNTSSDAVVSHKYNQPGKYQVMLTVTNSYNKVSNVSKEIEIRDKNDAPTGTFIVDRTNADVPVNVSFNSMVTDIENDSISYVWDFGDGSTSSEVNPKHLYETPANYEPKLIVTDSLGAKTTITSGGLKLLPPNNPPTIQFAAIPDKATLKQNKDGLFTSLIKFTNDGTFDLDGEALSYSWDFGDGETSSEEIPLHEYKNSGNYNVKLTVVDERNAKVEKALTVSISKPLPNPVAVLNGTTGVAPLEVVFDGKGSSDYDGKPVTLKWDFGDGSSQLVDSLNDPIKHIYQNPGVYLVTLIASTPDNRFKRLNPGNIIINENNAPVGQIVKLEGDEKGILGSAMVKLTAMGSHDPSGGMVNYKWSWSARTWDLNANLDDTSILINEELSMSGSVLSGEDFEYTFNMVGQFTPVLEIEKEDGSKFKFFGETFTILEDQAPIAIAKLLSEESSITVGTEIGFDGSDSHDPKANGIKLFTWDFGDGEKSNEMSPKHIYNKEGTFTPTLIVVDNENKIGFAQAPSINVSNLSDSEGTVLSRGVRRDLPRQISTQSHTALLTDTEPELQLEEDPEKINDAIQAMISEVIENGLGDGKKPEIGPINLEPKLANPGSALKLSAFVKDNIALSNFGYVVLSPDGKVVSQKIIDLINKNREGELNNEFFVEEKVDIPLNLTPGTYKIKLSATDTSGNKIANTSSTSNEEISINFDVSDKPEPASKYDLILAPSYVEEVVDTTLTTTHRSTSKKSKGKYHLNTKNYNKVKSLESTYGLHVRGKRFFNEDKLLEIENNLKEKVKPINFNLKALAAGFSINSLTQAINPWIYPYPTATNSLTIDVIPGTSMDGYLAIGTMGSLSKTYFGNWYSVNVYIGGNKIGSIPWTRAAGISFSGSTPNAKVEFRPTNLSGVEFPSFTWASTFITFTSPVKPQITSISPTEWIAGRGTFDLYVYGNSFNQYSKVNLDNYSLTPYVSSANLLIVKVPAEAVKYAGIKNLSVKNLDGQVSSITPLNVKVNPNNACNIIQTLPQSHYGADAWTILGGNNTYLSSPAAIIETSGSVAIPFCLDKLYQVKFSPAYIHTRKSTSTSNSLTVWIDNAYIGRRDFSGSQSEIINDLYVPWLNAGSHILEFRFSGANGDTLSIGQVKIANGGGPVLDTFDPKVFGQEGIHRTINIYGSNFSPDTKAVLDSVQLATTFISENRLSTTLPNTFATAGQKQLYLVSDAMTSSVVYLTVSSKPELVSDTFKVNPIQPYPGSDFDIGLTVKDPLSEPTSFTTDIAVFDPDGSLITIPNISNNISTVKTTKQKNSDGTVSFLESLPLNISSKAGNYKSVASVSRGSNYGADLSSANALDYITSKALGLIKDIGTVPSSHQLSFTPKPAFNLVLGIEENDLENVGFVVTGAKVLQDGDSVKLKASVVSGDDQISMIKYNFLSSDGRESGLTTVDNYSFSYTNKSTSTTPNAYKTSLEVYWVENGIQNKIRNISGPTIYVYPNYKPIAKARVLSEQYPVFAKGISLSTAFVDAGSYDSNQRFSRGVDYVDSKLNKWELYRVQASLNQDGMIYTNSLPTLSEDKKTFYSGNIVENGNYFAKLTVTDKTGLSDAATTESVTVAPTYQRVGVFATTEPSDKKIYDGTTGIQDNGTTGQQSSIPVMFKSTIFGNYKSIAYLWDFGDGACSSLMAYPECTVANPTHNYFDGNKSFGGIEFKDRKSVTPKVKINAAFGDGRTESWEASAGTITFNTEPQFVLVDLKADNYSGVAPFTVNLMIDPSTAKVINATPTKYELDWGDGSEITTSVITFEELIAKSFTHTYTIPETYNPKLKIYINETTKVFEFNVGDVVVGATGVGGISLLDDLNTISITNQPIVTFMVNTVFANPNDPKNRLRINIKDEENNESVTELVPNSNNQTISLSEGENAYYFETLDGSNQTIMSEAREITLDSTNPFIEITSPREGDVTPGGSKIYLSGIATDENINSISYKVNDQTAYSQVSSSDIEDIDDSNNVKVQSKFFYIELDPIVVGSVNKISVLVKDKAGNESLEEIDLNRSVKLLSQTSGIAEVENDGVEYPINPGAKFRLVTNKFGICDDTVKPDKNLSENKGEPLYSLAIYDDSEITIEGMSFNVGGIGGIYSQNTPGAYQNINSCIDINDFAIHSTQDLDYSSTLKPGSYAINNKITATSLSYTKYGTSFNPAGFLTSSNSFKVKILRDTNAFINSVSSNNLELNKPNNISFNILFTDSIPFTSERAQNAQISSDYLLTPSNMQDPINLTCSVISDQTYPSNSLTQKCSFTYTPSEVTGINGSKYKLDFKILFPQEIGESERPTRYGKLEFSPSFIVPGNITTPSEYTVIQSSNQTVEGSIDKTSLTNIVGMIDDSTAISFAMFSLQFNQNGIIEDLTSATNQLISRTNNGNSNLLTYGTNVNFNLNKNSHFSPYFKDLSVFGPVNLYTALTAASNNNYSSNQGRKLILLDKPKIQDAQITSNAKKLQKTLKLKIANNAPTMGDYALEVVLESRDNDGNLISDSNYQNTVYVNIPNSSNSITKTIKIPSSTKTVKVTLNRNTNFLNEIEKRITSLSGWDISKFNKNNYKKADEKEVISTKNQVTDISIDKQSAILNETITATYVVKKLKGSHLTLRGKYKNYDGEKTLPQDSINNLSGNIQYTVKQDWVDRYSEIRFELYSGGEFDSTVLKLGDSSQVLFNVGDLDDKEVTVDGKNISVHELNSLLLDLGYLSSAQNGYTEATRDAFASFICDYNSSLSGLNSQLRQQVLQSGCSLNVHPEFKATEDNVKVVLGIQQFLQGLIDSNVELYNYIKLNPAVAVFIIPLSALAGTLINITTGNIRLLIGTIFGVFGISGTVDQVNDIVSRVQQQSSKGVYYVTGYSVGEVVKIVGIAAIAGTAFKVGETIGFSFRIIQAAEIVNSKGLTDLYITLLDQLALLNRSTDAEKTAIKAGLERFIETTESINNLNIFKDYVRLWNIQDVNQVFSLRDSAYNLLNQIVGKFNNKSVFFKIYEIDSEGFNTGVIRNILIDKRLQEGASAKNISISDSVANGIKNKVNGSIQSVNQQFENDGLLLAGNAIPKAQVKSQVETLVTVSDLKQFYLLGSSFQNASEEVILSSIQSKDLIPSVLTGEIRGRTATRFWADTSQIDALKNTSNYTKEYIAGDDALALDLPPPIQKQIRLIISTENLPDQFFRIPTSIEGSRKFIPSPYNNNVYNGKSLGGFYEIISPPISTQNVMKIEVIE